MDASSRVRTPPGARLLSLLTFFSLMIATGVVIITLGGDLLGHMPMFVVSDSMVPTFRRGDLLIMDTHFKDLRPGDIVGYHASWAEAVVKESLLQKLNLVDARPIVTHRLVGINGSILTVKGDNNYSPDPPFASSLVVGRISHIIPKVGYLFSSWSIFVLAALALGATFLKDAFYGSASSSIASKLFMRQKKHSQALASSEAFQAGKEAEGGVFR